ncbi:hypothetical protein ANN_21012 [Periplaneta americana]|uniref:Uncharacterized protein n=1 Tax=Periplaneta americana TaxID=6978 RepID=A0ABQ8SEH6_PERAM|nr:hypothetical protein ANN_21012 [Periplaneta americana]
MAGLCKGGNEPPGSLKASISHGSEQSILHNDLKMQRVCEHVVPRSLTDEQREERQLVSGDLIDSVDQDPTL